MANSRNYTIGVDEDTYNYLKDLSMIKRLSMRKCILALVIPEYKNNRESIIKLKELLNSNKSSEIVDREKKEA